MLGSLLYPLLLVMAWYVVLRALYERNWVWKELTDSATRKPQTVLWAVQG
jgi:hypothetical protein